MQLAKAVIVGTDLNKELVAVPISNGGEILSPDAEIRSLGNGLYVFIPHHNKIS